MPTPPTRRLPPLALVPFALAPLALPLALAGCGAADDDRFAPPCPVPSIPRDTADLHRFRGQGRDIIDSVLDARITGVGGSCTRGERGFVSATISVGMDLVRGPATTARTADVSYFVAVSEGGNGPDARILDKRVYTLQAEFPPNTDRLRLSGNDIQLNLPVSATKTAAAYQVSVGFQLTPLELEVNRARPRR